MDSDFKTEDFEAASPDFKMLRERYERGEEFTEKDLDFIADVSIDFLQAIFDCFSITDVTIDEYTGEDGEIILDVDGNDVAVLIGHHGSTLHALQQIVSSHLSARLGFYFPLLVDVRGYRKRRRDQINKIALMAAERAVKQNRPIRLDAMNAYERRIVHVCLRDNHNVTTGSVGTEPARYVVVKPTFN